MIGTGSKIAPMRSIDSNLMTQNLVLTPSVNRPLYVLAFTHAVLA